MRCPGCGYVSFDSLLTCKHCGAPMGATSSLPHAAPAPAPVSWDAPAGELPVDLRNLHLEPEAPMPPDRPVPFARLQPAVEPAPDAGGDPGFHIDEDLFGTAAPAAVCGTLAAPFSFAGLDDAGPRLPPVRPEWEALRLEADPEPADAGCGPIIDRDEEVPERFWVPEVAGLGRRAAALLVDQALLAALLGLFVLGAWSALRLSGLDGGALFTWPVFLAVLPAFALLALLLSLAYHAYFHGRAGSTPGKALAGVAVRTGDGGIPSRGRAVLRWLAALLGFGCAGIGVAWALFEPRRRGWADLLSATVVAERRTIRAAAARR